MTDTVLQQLLRALDLVVIERLPNGSFHLVTPAPGWLDRAFDAAAPGGRRTLEGAFPFLDDVIHQAIGAWQAGPHASIVCGPFAATVDGDELLLRATALTIDGRTLLVIDRLLGTADARPMLQKARERMLEGEALTRRVAALHALAADVNRAVSAMAAASVPVTLIDPLNAANERLQSALRGLPTPPERQRR